MNCPECGKELFQLVRVWYKCTTGDPHPQIAQDIQANKVKISTIDFPPPADWTCPDHGFILRKPPYDIQRPEDYITMPEPDLIDEEEK